MIAVIIAILILVSKRRRKNLSTTGDSRAADTGRSLNIVFFEDSRLWARQCMYSVCMTDRRTGWTMTECYGNFIGSENSPSAWGKPSVIELIRILDRG